MARSDGAHALTIVDCGTLQRAADRFVLAPHPRRVGPPRHARGAPPRGARAAPRSAGARRGRELVVARRDPSAAALTLRALQSARRTRQAPLVLVPADRTSARLPRPGAHGGPGRLQAILGVLRDDRGDRERAGARRRRRLAASRHCRRRHRRADRPGRPTCARCSGSRSLACRPAPSTATSIFANNARLLAAVFAAVVIAQSPWLAGAQRLARRRVVCVLLVAVDTVLGARRRREHGRSSAPRWAPTARGWASRCSRTARWSSPPSRSRSRSICAPGAALCRRPRSRDRCRLPGAAGVAASLETFVAHERRSRIALLACSRSVALATSARFAARLPATLALPTATRARDRTTSPTPTRASALRQAARRRATRPRRGPRGSSLGPSHACQRPVPRVFGVSLPVLIALEAAAACSARRRGAALVVGGVRSPPSPRVRAVRAASLAARRGQAAGPRGHDGGDREHRARLPDRPRALRPAVRRARARSTAPAHPARWSGRSPALRAAVGGRARRARSAPPTPTCASGTCSADARSPARRPSACPGT